MVPKMNAGYGVGNAAGYAGPLSAWVVLARSRDTRGQTLSQQALVLGLTESALIYLGACEAPRPEQRDEDVAVVANRVGLAPAILGRLLREAEALGPGARRSTGGLTRQPADRHIPQAFTHAPDDLARRLPALALPPRQAAR